MKRIIRRWLGLDRLATIEAQLSTAQAQIATLGAVITNLRTAVEVQNLAAGRIIAKLDPAFVTPHDDPARKAESDRLGEEVIRRIKAEHAFSNRMDPSR